MQLLRHVVCSRCVELTWCAAQALPSQEVAGQASCFEDPELALTPHGARNNVNNVKELQVMRKKVKYRIN